MRKYFGKLDSYLCYLLLFAFLVVISYLMTYDSTAENGIRLSCNEGEDLAHCDSGEAGIAYETGLTLKKGEYELSVYYAATSEENEVIVQYEDMIILDEYLEVTDGLVTKYTLQIPQDIAGATLSYRYSGSGSLDLFYFTLVPLQPWYHDAYLRIGLLWLVVIGLIAMRICTKRGDIECKKRVVELFCVFIIGIMAALPFLADTSF